MIISDCANCCEDFDDDDDDDDGDEDFNADRLRIFRDDGVFRIEDFALDLSLISSFDMVDDDDFFIIVDDSLFLVRLS